MPKYFYVCAECEKHFDFYHDMNEKKTSCPACEVENSLKKLPSYFSTKKYEEDSTKTGQVVKQSIKDFKEDLQEQKDNLRKEYLETNE